MAGVKKLVGAYLILVAVVVAVYFIINAFLVDTLDVQGIWYVLDVLMLIGLALALVHNYMRKKAANSADSSGPVSRAYFEANTAFYLTAGITILFLHNWFSLLAQGGDSPDGNHQAWVIWAVVDTMLPIVLGITGCHLWMNSSES